MNKTPDRDDPPEEIIREELSYDDARQREVDDDSNPNNCSTCDYSKDPDGGHCYMFADAPTEVCMQHTLRKVGIIGRPSVIGIAAMVAVEMSKNADDPLTDVLLDIARGTK